MASTGMRKQEGIGLFVAVALHAAVLAILLIRLPHHAVVKPPERVEVTISDEVGMTSTSPDPRSQAAPDSAPELGEPAPEAPPVPEIAPEPAPLPLQPAPRPVEAPRPKPTPKPAPKAIQKPKPAEQAPPRNSSSRKSSAIDAIVSQPSRASPSSSKVKAPPKKSGGSSFAEAFKQGTPDAKSASGSGAPASAIGPKQVSALVAAVNRQLKPHWQAPQGADADLLVTRVRFRLNRDGSLSGEPQVLSTSGQTPANQAQVQRHQEQAVRAIKLAAPFSLPDDLYEGWKIVTTNFDRRLSQ